MDLCSQIEGLLRTFTNNRCTTMYVLKTIKAGLALGVSPMRVILIKKYSVYA
jgi:hypothetical protein